MAMAGRGQALAFAGLMGHPSSETVMGHSCHPVVRWCNRCGALICAAIATAAAPNNARGTVELNVTHVGFPTLRGENVVRSGAWAPITVDLALLDQQSFDGSVRVGQLDVDGDECYDRVDVHLRAETGGNQRLYLYALANPLRLQGRITVELFDDEGEAVEVVSQGELTFQAQPAQWFSVIADDEILVLSLSTGALGRVKDLVDPDQEDLYERALHVGHMSPTDLPELWIGLEAVDYIVWDGARPEELTERQLGALLEWVRQGGTLLIAASRTAGSLALTDAIYRVLPVDIGDIAVVDNLPEVRRSLLGLPDVEHGRQRGKSDDPWWKVPFDTPIPVVQCTLRDGASRVPRDGVNSSNVITRRRIGRGHVIFSAVTLKDLLSAPGSPVDFFQKLFHLRLLTGEEPVRPSQVTLFPHVVSAIAFSAWGSLYLVAAFAFSSVYLLFATFGTWWFLGSRRWKHHSWSVFAVVALVASLLSVIAVNSVHGFGETLHQISIVDVDAGKAHGYATAFFGLKTGTDKELDLWLPSDRLAASEPGATDCFLRPIPPTNDPTEASTSFADPEEYRLLPANAVIDDVHPCDTQAA